MALIAGVAVLVLGCVLGWLARYMVIEPESLHVACTADASRAVCLARGLLVDVTFSGTWGVTAVAGGIAVWMVRGRIAIAVALLALFAGGLGLYLFDTAWAASGVLCVLLRLPGINERPANSDIFRA